MKIGIAQINTIAGNVEANLKKIDSTIENIGRDSDIIIFPELAISGSPLYDMSNSKELINQQMLAIKHIKDVVERIKEGLIVIMGFIDTQGDEDKKIFNSAAIIGDDIKVYHKQELLNRGIKNEPRYFTQGKDNLLFTFGGKYTGSVVIGNDIDNEMIVNRLKEKGIDAVFHLASDYFEGGNRKNEILRSKEIQKALNSVYVKVNQVGSECGITFDGGSKIISKKGEMLNNSKKFEEVIEIIDTEDENKDYSKEFQEVEAKEDVLQTLKLGLKDYLEKRHIQDVVIGVSGGMDSALDLFIIAQVVSADHIHAIYMPTQFNSNESLLLSQQLAGNLGIELSVGPIQNLLKSYEEFSDIYLGRELKGVSHENIQARIRGNILMNLGNDYNAMVINNSNKTELELGYGTLYGDLIGGLCLIGDLKKTEVYDLAKYINRDKEIIPRGIINRTASAELSEGQIDPFNYNRDCDSVDDLAAGKTVDSVSKKYNMSKEYVQSLKNRINRSRFKSAQIPPILKISSNTIGQGTKHPF